MRKGTIDLITGALEEFEENIQRVRQARDQAKAQFDELNKSLADLEIMGADLQNDLAEALAQEKK